ncbi:hypothetical protein, partial [uncultured Ruminococcus sp.]|uniref:hypothetical protein n=1 Tax=uncultured Ruminococcus sp. TaxID=165186 RepID=UPI00260256B8
SKTVSFFILSHFGTFVKWIFYEQNKINLLSNSRSAFSIPCPHPLDFHSRRVTNIIISAFLVNVK